jgi:hypothetical protein
MGLGIRQEKADGQSQRQEVGKEKGLAQKVCQKIEAMSPRRHPSLLPRAGFSMVLAGRGNFASWLCSIIAAAFIDAAQRCTSD